MTEALAPTEHKQAVVTFDNKQQQLLLETVCKGATADEFALFMIQCQRTGLDPFVRQIYAVKRWDASLKRNAMAVQVSIDGFRLIAERSGKYAGQIGPYWCGDDGVWQEVWLKNEPPAAAKVGVMRNDFAEPLWGVARFEAYKGTKKDGGLNSMWSRMADVMIAKCAESLALRKAFPQELSGLYTGDEMDQAGEAVVVESKPAKKQATPKASHTTPKASQAPPVEHVTDFEDDGEHVIEVRQTEKEFSGKPLYHIFTTARKYTCFEPDAVEMAKSALNSGATISPTYEEKSIGKSGRHYNALSAIDIVETTTGEIMEADIAEAMPTAAVVEGEVEIAKELTEDEISF